MKKLTTAILIIALMAGTVSCKKDLVGEGPVTTETRNIANFLGIILEMNGNVYYKNDPQWKLEVTAKESIHGILETKVVNDRLVLKYNNGRTYDADESIRIKVSGPGVTSFETSSTGSIYGEGTVQGNSVYLRSGRSGNIYLQQVMANSIEALSTQSGTLRITGGSATNVKLKTDGSGKIDMSGMAANNVNARIVGSGDISVKVSDHLDATIDGSGSIYFNGSPNITTHINGTGRLVRY